MRIQSFKWCMLGFLLVASFGLWSQSSTRDATDASLEAEVKARMVGEDLLSGAAITVQIRDGIAQLAGFVDEAGTKETALSAAAAVEGIHTVDDQIHLKSGDTSVSQAVDDHVITTGVRGALTQAYPTTAVGIEVAADGGVVLLSGFLADERTRSEAGEIARDVSGVEAVINGIYVLD